MNNYQDKARKTAIFPEDLAIPYLTLGLTGEAGEVAEKIKKALRDPSKPLDSAAVALELGDVLWYLAMLSDYLGYRLEDIAEMNLQKLKSRQDRAKLQGSGDNR